MMKKSKRQKACSKQSDDEADVESEEPLLHHSRPRAMTTSEDGKGRRKLPAHVPRLNTLRNIPEGTEEDDNEEEVIVTVGSSHSVEGLVPLQGRKRSVSYGSHVFQVTNYGKVDIDNVSICSLDLSEGSEGNLSRRPSISPLEADHAQTRRPSTPLPVDLSQLSIDRAFSKRSLADINKRRGSYTPSQKSIDILPTQEEEKDDNGHGEQEWKGSFEFPDFPDNANDVQANDVNANKLRQSKSELIRKKPTQLKPRASSFHHGPLQVNHKLSKSDVFDIEEGDPLSNKTQHSAPWADGHHYQLMEIARRGRLYAQRKQQGRLVEKNGECNVTYIKVEKRGMKYLTDIFTTFLEIQWRYTVIVFFLSFCFTWVSFGLLWWALYAIRSDTECIVGVDSFITALLFSIETQHTIGYGTRSITDSCPFGTILLMTQSTIGVMIQCIVTGIVFAKLARPKARAATVMFSKHAVILKQDGVMCLMFRVGNMRRTQMMGTTLNAIFVQNKLTEEGDIISFYQQNLEVTREGEDDFYFLAWPIRVKHIINDKSPLWNYSAEDLLKADFEIIVVLEAVCEATGGSTQVRTSYLPGEIQWGYKLASLMTRHKVDKKSGRYKIDFTKFDKTEPVEVPEESAAKQLGRVSRINSSVYKIENETKL